MYGRINPGWAGQPTVPPRWMNSLSPSTCNSQLFHFVYLPKVLLPCIRTNLQAVLELPAGGVLGSPMTLAGRLAIPNPNPFDPSVSAVRLLLTFFVSTSNSVPPSCSSSGCLFFDRLALLSWKPPHEWCEWVESVYFLLILLTKLHQTEESNLQHCIGVDIDECIVL